MAAQKSQSPSMEFLVTALKANPKAVYGDLKAKADEEKLKVFPIMYGRAQAMLGLVKSAKRGTGKAARATAARAAGNAAPAKRGRPVQAASKSARIRELLGSGMSAADIAKRVGSTTALVYNIKSSMNGSAGAPRRGPGRPRKNVGDAGLDGIAGIMDAVKNSERDKARMRQALERIRMVLADALA